VNLCSARRAVGDSCMQQTVARECNSAPWGVTIGAANRPGWSPEGDTLTSIVMHAKRRLLCQPPERCTPRPQTSFPLMHSLFISSSNGQFLFWKTLINSFASLFLSHAVFDECVFVHFGKLACAIFAPA
jgi:hypothetical protein